MVDVVLSISSLDILLPKNICALGWLCGIPKTSAVAHFNPHPYAFEWQPTRLPHIPSLG